MNRTVFFRHNIKVMGTLFPSFAQIYLHSKQGIGAEQSCRKSFHCYRRLCFKLCDFVTSTYIRKPPAFSRGVCFFVLFPSDEALSCGHVGGRSISFFLLPLVEETLKPIRTCCSLREQRTESVWLLACLSCFTVSHILFL